MEEKLLSLMREFKADEKRYLKDFAEAEREGGPACSYAWPPARLPACPPAWLAYLASSLRHACRSMPQPAEPVRAQERTA